MKKKNPQGTRNALLAIASAAAPFALLVAVGCPGPAPTATPTPGATAAPTAAPTPAATAVPDNGNPKIPASHQYYTQSADNCTACHADLTNKVFQPFPASHVGRTNTMCASCHNKAAEATPPVLKMTVAKITTGEAPAIDATGTDGAWSKATELEIPLKGGINKSETTKKLKAVHDGTNVYFLATWADPTESLERGPFVKQADGTWKKTPYYPSNYEDKVGFIWHTGTGMDGFKTQGCAVTCHATTANRDRPLKYTDSGTKLDMWHAKMVRTVMPANVQQIDDQNIIWTDLLDDASGSGKEWDDMIKDGGRRGEPKTGGGYTDNPKNTDGSPKWMPGAEPFKVTDGRSFWLSGATSSFDNTKFVAGDKVAAIHVAKLLGDRGDLPAQAKWASGTWTMEWSRALKTANTDGRDVQFTAGGTSYMGAAFFDNAQIGHSVQFGVTEVTFAP